MVYTALLHTKAIEDEHYLMMMEEDHKHAVELITDPKVGANPSAPSNLQFSQM